MTAFTYNAQRNIIGGHTQGTDYDLEPGAQVADISWTSTKKEATSIGGNTETYLHRLDQIWAVQVGVIDEADMAQWREFMSSVAASEQFTFDAYGSIAVPDNAQTVIMVGDPTIRRIGPTIKKYFISFSMRVV